MLPFLLVEWSTVKCVVKLGAISMEMLEHLVVPDIKMFLLIHTMLMVYHSLMELMDQEYIFGHLSMDFQKIIPEVMHVLVSQTPTVPQHHRLLGLTTFVNQAMPIQIISE